mgnify:CR=1 FL=1
MKLKSELETTGAKLFAVIVTYNGLRWIDRCLSSLQNTNGSIHSVVIDNGSTDGTVEAVQARFPEVELVRSERNLGFGQANNIGLRMALERNADHVFLLNQDAWVTPSTIGQLVRHAERDPRYGVLSPMHRNGAGDALELDFSTYIVPGKCPDLYSDIALDRLRDQTYPVEFVNAAAWLISRKCLTTVGGFSPSFFHYAEDDNYVDRMRYHKLLVGIVPTTWVHHDRVHNSENPFFTDPKALSVRRAALKYSDPASHTSPKAEVRVLRSTMVRCLLSGQRAAYQVARRQAAVLGTLSSDDLTKCRDASRATGATFL